MRGHKFRQVCSTTALLLTAITSLIYNSTNMQSAAERNMLLHHRLSQQESYLSVLPVARA